MNNLVRINIFLGEFTYRSIKWISDNNGHGYIISGIGDLEAAFSYSVLERE